MGFRFRRSVRLAPGVRLNFSGSGLSWSLGPRGASMNFGKRGTYFNTGIPGTGFYARERLDGRGSRAAGSTAPSPGRRTMSIDVRTTVEDDGAVVFRDLQGNALPAKLVELHKKQNGDTIRGLIAQACAQMNEPIEALSQIHVNTPDAHHRPSYVVKRFEVPCPTEPQPQTLGFWDKVFSSRASAKRAQDLAARARYDEERGRWEAQKKAFDDAEAVRADFFNRRILVEVGAMEQHLENTLQDIVWPRETLVSFDIADDGKTVVLDVDLPEVEDMPNRTAVVPGREYRLGVKMMSDAAIRRLYSAHIHGIGFRIIGETFAALPTVTTVVLSGYSQRPDKTTGAVGDEYLYSVRVKREQWNAIHFDNLGAVDVVEALARFEMRRQMTKSGVFRPIEPLVAAHAGPPHEPHLQLTDSGAQPCTRGGVEVLQPLAGSPAVGGDKV